MLNVDHDKGQGVTRSPQRRYHTQNLPHKDILKHNSILTVDYDKVKSVQELLRLPPLALAKIPVRVRSHQKRKLRKANKSGRGKKRDSGRDSRNRKPFGKQTERVEIDKGHSTILVNPRWRKNAPVLYEQPVSTRTWYLFEWSSNPFILCVENTGWTSGTRWESNPDTHHLPLHLDFPPASSPQRRTCLFARYSPMICLFVMIGKKNEGPSWS